ncbi:hypothetical protein ABPG72_012648 [Tetrahymena utriculariae]
MFSKASKLTSVPLSKEPLKQTTAANKTNIMEPPKIKTPSTLSRPLGVGNIAGMQKPIQTQTKSTLQKQAPQQFEEQKTQGFTSKPSSKYTSIKTVDLFATNKNQNTNSFAYVYNAGGIPCRVNHGSVHMYVQWNKDVDLKSMPYDPLLATCFEGLIEEKHPYNFIAYNCVKEMLEQDNAEDKIVPMINKLAWPLRNALQHNNEKNFENALTVLKLLSDKIGPNLNPHLKNLLQPIVKKMNKPQLREKIFVTLRTLEENGGSDVLKTIKSCIPTYSNV